jgi:hypothetical protein
MRPTWILCGCSSSSSPIDCRVTNGALPLLGRKQVAPPLPLTLKPALTVDRHVFLLWDMTSA